MHPATPLLAVLAAAALAAPGGSPAAARRLPPAAFNQPPVAVITTDSVTTSGGYLYHHLSATGSYDLDGPIVQYAWRTSCTAPGNQTAGSSFTFVVGTAEECEVRLTVLDAYGAKGQEFLELTV